MSIVLITGSSTGIGMEAALHLAEKGHRVYASMRNLDGGQGIRDAAADRKVSVELIQLDVNDDSSANKAVAEVLDREGRIDVLVNNAGIAPLGPLEKLDDGTVSNVLDTNVLGVLRCVRAVLPAMRKQRSGTIVNVGSVAGHIATVCSGIYVASKFALEGLSEVLAQEVKPFGIHVALIKPGFIVTPIFGKALGELSSYSDSAYPNAVKIAFDLFTNGQQTGGTVASVAETIEEAINELSKEFKRALTDTRKKD